MQLNTFSGGVVSMARNCQAAIELVRRGTWTLDKMDRWLLAVIANDPSFLSEVKTELEAVMTHESAHLITDPTEGLKKAESETERLRIEIRQLTKAFAIILRSQPTPYDEVIAKLKGAK